VASVAEITRDAERLQKRVDESRKRIERAQQIGAYIGSLIPGIGTYIGAVAGTIAQGAAEIYGAIDEVLTDGKRRWVEVRDEFGTRMMPVGWTPNGKQPWEKVKNGDMWFRARRAREDGVARSRILAFLSREIRSLGNADLAAKLADQARAQEQRERAARSFDTFDPAYERLVNPTLANVEKANRGAEATATVRALYALSHLKREGLSRPEAYALVRQKFGRALPGEDEARRRHDAADRFVGGGGGGGGSHTRRVGPDGTVVERFVDADGNVREVVRRPNAPADVRTFSLPDGFRLSERSPDRGIEEAPGKKALVKKPEATSPTVARSPMQPIQLSQLASVVRQVPDGGQRTFRLGPLVLVVGHRGSQWAVRATLTTNDGVGSATFLADERLVAATLRKLAAAGRITMDSISGEDDDGFDVVGATVRHVVRTSTNKAGQRVQTSRRTSSPGGGGGVHHLKNPKPGVVWRGQNLGHSALGRLRYGLPPFPLRRVAA
jgi:hypothetical protein